MSEYSLEDLKETGTNEYRQIPTGNYTVNRKGRRVPVTEGVEFIPTRLGKIPEDEWCRMAEEAVKCEGKEDLYEAIISYSKARSPWLRTDEMLRRWALGCLISEAYKHWDDFEGGKA